MFSLVFLYLQKKKLCIRQIETLIIMLGVLIIRNYICQNNKKYNKLSFFGDTLYETKLVFIRGLLFSVTIALDSSALLFATPAEITTLFGLSSIWIPLMGSFILKEKLKKSLILGIVLVIIGIILICQPRFIFGDNSMFSDDSDIDSESKVTPYAYLGYIMVILSTFTVTAYVMVLRIHKNTLHWIQFEFVAAFCSVFFIFPILFSIFICYNYYSHNMTTNITLLMVTFLFVCGCLGLCVCVCVCAYCLCFYVFFFFLQTH